MSEPFNMYHWSPSSRRPQILRYGFRVGMWSTDRLWRPPFICFANSPRLAWDLSGGTERGLEHDLWDLWLMESTVPSGYEEIIDDRNDSVKEYRVYERIYKRDLWYVGTRPSKTNARSDR